MALSKDTMKIVSSFNERLGIKIYHVHRYDLIVGLYKGEPNYTWRKLPAEFLSEHEAQEYIERYEEFDREKATQKPS